MRGFLLPIIQGLNALLTLKPRGIESEDLKTEFHVSKRAKLKMGNLLTLAQTFKDPERIKALLGKTAQLNFRLVSENNNEFVPPFMVVTDLDGTLLDHHSYSYEAAIPALDKLTDFKIPVIFNTSKTAKEVIPLQQKLSISAPFIVENGSALYIPKRVSKTIFTQGNKNPQIFNSSITEEYYYLLFGYFHFLLI